MEKTEQKVKIRVIEQFLDKNDHTTLYEVGQELEFDPARAEDVTGRQLAEYVTPLG